MSNAEKLTEVRRLREQATYLASPFRRTGPSCFDEDVQAEVKRLRAQADTLDEELFYASSPVLQV